MALLPNGHQVFEVEGLPVQVPKCSLTFAPWEGEAIAHTFGGKPLIDIAGRPGFAEEAILQLFLDADWDARWVEVYGAVHAPKFLKRWKDAPWREQEHVPIPAAHVLQRLARTAERNGGHYSGCWDVLAWKGDDMVLAEGKREGKDRVRRTQTDWLKAALAEGFLPQHLLVVEWTM